MVIRVAVPTNIKVAKFGENAMVPFLTLSTLEPLSGCCVD